MASSTSGTDLYKRRLINSEPDNSQIPRRDMTSCEICKIRVTKGNLSRHTKTQTHQRALSRVSFDNQYVVDFLNESTKSKANQRNGCLSSFLDAITSGRLTSLIDQKDCWGVGKTPMVFPSDLGCNLADLHEDVMRNSAKGATVYEVGRSYSPKTNKMAALWESYFSPASERCFYAVDVLVSSLRLEIPHELAAKQNNYNRHGLITTANVTPTGTFVDLHIDNGLEVFSTSPNSTKIWAFYPPTVENINIFYETSLQSEKFSRLQSRLEHGRFAITRPDEGVVLPSGCIHATYTLKGGILVGIAWTGAQDLDTIIGIVTKELATDHVSDEQLPPLLQSIYQALVAKCLTSDALERICAWGVYRLKSNKKIAEILDQIKKAEQPYPPCPRCSDSPSKHLERLFSPGRKN